MQSLFLNHEHYYDIKDLRNYDPYDQASLSIDLKKIKSDPVRSKLELPLYIYILENYAPILEMMIYNLPFVLKSQLLDILGYDNIGKSRSNGYKILHDLEKNKLITSKIYNGSQYVFPSYRAYYYFGIKKKSIETKPPERLLNKYFILAEIYLIWFQHTVNHNRPLSDRETRKFREDYFYSKNRKVNQSAFTDIPNIEQKQIKYIADFINSLNKKRLFDSNNHLSNILSNPYLIDELSQKQRALYFSLFLQEAVHYLESRCYINCFKNDDSINFSICIIHEPNRSWIYYNRLINDLNQLFYATDLFYYVTSNILILTFDKNDSSEVKSTFKNMLQKRDKMEMPKQELFYQKSNEFIEGFNVINVDVARRISKQNQYTSNRSQPSNLI